MTYQEGIEDGIQLCLHELSSNKSKEQIKTQIEGYLKTVQERKIDGIKKLLTH